MTVASVQWGTAIRQMPVHLERERDLEYYDGPLIVVHRNAAQDPYLEVWLERVGSDDLVVDRWFLFRVSELELTMYEFSKRTLRDTVLSARDGYGFVREFSSSKLLRISVLPVQDLPEEYLPSADSLHDPLLNPHFAGTRSDQLFLLDGQWELDQFKDLERKYKQAYSFMAAFGPAHIASKELLNQRLGKQSFESGWNYKTAFDLLDAALPAQARARMSAVQYASPGYLRFRVDAGVANSLRVALTAFVASPKELWKKYDSAHRLVIELGRLHEAIRVDGEARSEEVERLETALRPRLVELASELRGVDTRSLFLTSKSLYVAGELLVTFVRRMQALVDYAEQNAELAGMPTKKVATD